ncbi:MAG: prepilin-type N-terminal cleavage/methylation domain-containing protein [Pseudomonadota bacterium]
MHGRQAEELTRNRQSDSGFSLIEVIVVLMLVALATTLTLAYLRTEPDVVSARRDLQTALASARARAVSESRVINLVLVRTNAELDNLRIEGEPFVLPEFIEATVVSPLKIQSENDAAVLRFYPDESTSGGTVILKSDTDARSRVDFDWFSGAITVKD